MRCGKAVELKGKRKIGHGGSNVTALVGNVRVLREPFMAMAGGWWLEAKFGEPLFGVVEGASNGGVRNFLRFGGGYVKCGKGLFVRLNKGVLDKGGELVSEPGMSHEWNLDG